MKSKKKFPIFTISLSLSIILQYFYLAALLQENNKSQNNVQKGYLPSGYIKMDESKVSYIYTYFFVI